MRQNRANAYTLVELLVVLSIVFVLAALLFPVFASARRKANDKVCVSNLGQIGHALAMYTADYDGAYPLPVVGQVVNHQTAGGALLWGDLLSSYLRAVNFPTCPAAEIPSYISEQVKGKSDYTGYALNGYLSLAFGKRGRYALGGRPETVLKSPACTVTVLDVRVGIWTAFATDIARTQEGMRNNFGLRVDDNKDYPFITQTPGAVRHSGGANYAFADGHVKWLLPAHIKTDKVSDGLTPGFGL